MNDKQDKARDSNDILREKGVDGLREAFDKAHEKKTQQRGVTLDDFAAYMPMHNYIFKPTGALWPASSVNARVPPIHVGPGPDDSIPASAWLDRHRPIEAMTWVPDKPQLIHDRLISEGGWIEREGCTSYNLYRPPTIKRRGVDASPWINHVEKVFPNDVGHIIPWLAHRVQKPGEKINHALVLGGKPGIGKDTALAPVIHAVGPWNFQEITPPQLLGRFNGYLRSVILRVNEAHDLGEMSRRSFYERMKVHAAAPPDVLRCDEKNIREYPVVNVTGIIITTNHRADGLYLPADDRRHFVAWSNLENDPFPAAYWINLYQWFDRGGFEAVAEYLAALDLTGFDPKKPPEKTEAFWTIVNANRTPENSEMADILERMNYPNAISLKWVVALASEDFKAYLTDRQNRRTIPYRFEDCDYVPCRNPDAKDGLWTIGGERQVIYVKHDLAFNMAIQAARKFVTGK